MQLSELLAYLSEVFEQLQIPHLITGSIASIAYGEPRFTNDIDVVVRLSEREIADFCKAFPSP